MTAGAGKHPDSAPAAPRPQPQSKSPQLGSCNRTMIRGPSVRDIDAAGGMPWLLGKADNHYAFTATDVLDNDTTLRPVNPLLLNRSPPLVWWGNCVGEPT